MNRNENLSIMLVEPHALGRRLMRDLLKALGVGVVVTFETLEDALESLEEVHVDAVFADWSGSTDAIALLDMLRSSDSANRYVPVVVVSAFNDVDHVRRARDSGANEYILKPFTPKVVAARLQAVTQHPRPFVEGGNFFGPDRRRHHLTWQSAERRRTTRYVERRFHDQPWTGPDRRSRADTPAHLPPNEVMPTSIEA